MMIHGGGQLFPLHLLFQLLILIAFLVVVWWVLKGGKLQRGESAREILDRRFASGEISKNEYHKMRKELEG